MAPLSFACRYCKKPNVARSRQGLKSHISQSPECRARRDKEHLLLSHSESAPAKSRHTSENRACAEEFEESSPLFSNNADEHHSKRARVDEDEDVEDFRPTNVNFIVDYPAEARAGATLEASQDGLETRFEKIKRTQQHAGSKPWAPFNSLADWELAQWLVQSGVSQQEIDKFLKLELVRTEVYHGCP
jgi:hypothetical protein